MFALSAGSLVLARRDRLGDVGRWWRVGAYFRDVVTIMLALPARSSGPCSQRCGGVLGGRSVCRAGACGHPDAGHVHRIPRAPSRLPKPLIEMSTAYRVPAGRLFGWLVLPAMAPHLRGLPVRGAAAGWGALVAGRVLREQLGRGLSGPHSGYDAGNFDGLMGWGRD